MKRMNKKQIQEELRKLNSSVYMDIDMTRESILSNEHYDYDDEKFELNRESRAILLDSLRNLEFVKDKLNSILWSS